nr:uncharacterized protein LOC110376256 [Helicoverpa armigera]
MVLLKLFLFLGFVVLAAVTCTNLAHVRNNHHKARVTREAEKGDNSLENTNAFIEEKLMHQNQALEHLIIEVDKSSDMIKTLIDTLSKGLEKPNLPIRVDPGDEPQNTNKPSNSNEGQDHPIGRQGKEHAIARLGKNLPKYGKLAKDLLVKDVYTGTDPTPIVEQITDGPLLLQSRRSNGGDPTLGSDPHSNGIKVNPWCPMALLCPKSEDPICGFDDEFGYGKFENFCHLLRVNCYWKYNFSIVISCSPKL